MKKTLWTFDFTVITIGTIISAIGSVAMSFALSLVVFDETQSTWLTGVFTAVSFIPSVVIPLLVAPYVDKHNRKHLIVRLDMLSGILYLIFTIYLLNNDFSYYMYLLFTVLIGSIGAIYNLAYSSLYPELIPQGFAQKGYSISSVIYPSVVAFVTPIASFMYISFGIVSVCLLEGILLLGASFFEHLIRYQEHRDSTEDTYTLKTYKEDIFEGLGYLKKEKGIRNIYSYMAVSNGSAQGISLMMQAFFQSSTIFTVTMYAFLSTAEMAGRICGSIFHYFVKIPAKRRFDIAASVYVSYEALDMMLLFIAYPLMIVNRFTAGFLGINSLNIREASTQNYIPSNMRARVNAFFSVIVAFCTLGARLLAGLLGELFPFAYVCLFFASLSMIAVLFIVIRNRNTIKPIFNQDI
ncbi:MAG: MFS transporter [Longicatena sp.]